MAEYTFDVAKLKNGDMMRVEIEKEAVVLARVEGQIIAFGGKCTHYEAPLEDGVLHGYTVMCPWHHACFDIRTGERLEPPALEDLPSYEVREENGKATVAFPHNNVTQPQGRTAPNAEQSFVIVGGGAAGDYAAETLRREGYTGKLILISSVPEAPIDRPMLSKDYLNNGDEKRGDVPLRDEKWYAERDIALLRNATVTRIDPGAHTVTLDTGATLTYDKLLLATGAEPLPLDAPGSDLGNVYLLRNFADSTTIIRAADTHKHAVVIGGSFIGMEVAYSLRDGHGIAVTVVAQEKIPFEKVMGDKVGKFIQKKHESHGVKFRLGAEVESLIGEDGQVTGVRLKDGEVIPADFVVIGVGVKPATGFLKSAGLDMDEKDGSLKVSATLQTSDPDIFAAGDIARWDDGSKKGMRVEHWRLAQQHGMVAARNMLGQGEDFNKHVPFFWTTQWKVEFRYVGHAEEWDEIIYRGKPETGKYLAFYLKKGKLLAASGSEYDPEMDAIEFMMREGIKLTPDQMRDEKYDLVAALNK